MTQNNENQTEPVFILEQGDEINTAELLENTNTHGSNFVEPDAETCIIFSQNETPSEKWSAVSISTEEGFHGFVQVPSETQLTVLSRENETNPKIAFETDFDESDLDLNFRALGVGIQNPGHVTEANESKIPLIVYDTIMTERWYYCMALGKNGEIEEIIVDHDSSFQPTAKGFSNEWPDDYDEWDSVPEDHFDAEPQEIIDGLTNADTDQTELE